MIQINFIEPSEPEKRTAFENWRDGCALEQASLNQAMTAWLDEWAQKPVPATEPERKQHLKEKSQGKPKIKSTIYAGQKDYYSALDGLFRGRCAYCETEIYRSSFGDVDHFRPKGNVREYPNGAAARAAINGYDEEHPGYYWLAYEPTNLVLACDLCNRPNKKRSGNRTIGKHDFFPLETAFRAARPGEEINEAPLLVNPILEDPEIHLLLDETGVLAAKTARGQMCIDLLGLNDRDLPHARRRRYKEVRDLMGKLFGEFGSGDNARAEETLARIKEIKNGSGEYTMAARKAVADAKEEIMKREGGI